MPSSQPQPQPPDEIPPGQELPGGTRLEEFVIERVLGSGGFGITYLATDGSLGRKVVIKENLPAMFAYRERSSMAVLPRHSHGDEAESFAWSLENFEKEAAMLASLDHPGIVRVFRRFEANGTAYFVMPYVEGASLDEEIAERRAKGREFGEEELRGLLWWLLEALEYLHVRGIYHRDLKPGNILITDGGDPVLIDFGAARQRLGERSLTVIESPGYTPFEQMQSRGEVGAWSDLYALGATLCKVLTGEAPPKSADRILEDPFELLAGRAELRGRYSEELLASIDRALGVRSRDRWQSASEWREALEESESESDATGSVAMVQSESRADSPRASSAPSHRSHSSHSSHSSRPLAKPALDRAPGKPVDVSPPPRGRAALIALAAAALLAAGAFALLKAPAGGARLVVASDPPGAEVLVDGELAGVTPLTLRRDPGPVEVVARYRSWPEQRRRVELEIGEDAEEPAGVVLFVFEPVVLRLESDPGGAQVFEGEGGRLLGRTPLELGEGLEPGTKELRLALAGYEEARREVSLEVGSNLESVELSALPPALFRITSDPPGAEIEIGGTVRGEAPLELELPPLEQELAARYRGWPEQRRTVELEPGGESELVFVFEPVVLRVESEPAGAEVRVAGGGEVLGRTPLELGEGLEPGGVDLEVALAGYEVGRIEMELEPGDNAESVELAARPMEGREAGEVREFGGIEMVWCPPGEFLMGSPEGEEGRFDNETQHTVELMRGFWLAKYECTQGQWVSVMVSNPSHFKGSDLPVERVSWEDVQDWLAKMNELHPLTDGWKWALPTEAQWEYACRAGTTGAYGGTGNLDEKGWYRDNSGRKTHPVGSQAANGWGLHDMNGNVWEWCRDWFGDYFGGSVTDPTGAHSGSYRVNRGGCWSNSARYCRSACRGRAGPDYRSGNLGFRPAAVPAAR